MNVIETKLSGPLIIEPKVFGDGRGAFMETWSLKRYGQAGLPETFVQDNVSYSTKGVLRGLHYQNPFGQGKLVQVIKGRVLDVAVDIRVGSPTFGQYESVVLSEENHWQFYVPVGFAHGFCVLSDDAIFSYKCTEYYHPQTESGIAWNDPDIGIDWQMDNPILSQKDLTHMPLKDVSHQILPQFREVMV